MSEAPSTQSADDAAGASQAAVASVSPLESDSINPTAVASVNPLDSASQKPLASDLSIPVSAEPVPALSAGQVIRQTREAAGISVAHLAASLKVPAKTILAMEENNMAALPDLAFSRALASSICRTLKIEAAPILALMPSLPQAHVVTNQDVGLNLPMGSPFRLGFHFAWLKNSTFVIIACFVLATLAVANWPVVTAWLGQVQRSSPPAPASSSAEVKVLGVPNMVETTPVSPIVAPTPAVLPAPAVQAASAALSVTTPLTPSSGPALAVATPKAASSAAPTPVLATGPSSQFVFKATSSSWVEVTDAAGKPVWKKLLTTNEVVPVTAPVPARVLIGNVAGTTLTVNGAGFNFAPFAANNIARFEVK